MCVLVQPRSGDNQLSRLGRTGNWEDYRSLITYTVSHPSLYSLLVGPLGATAIAGVAKMGLSGFQ